MRGMKEEMSECKRNIERITDWMSSLEKSEKNLGKLNFWRSKVKKRTKRLQN